MYGFEQFVVKDDDRNQNVRINNNTNDYDTNRTTDSLDVFPAN